MSENQYSVWQEPTIKSEHVFKGNIIEVQVDTITLRDGTTRTREMVSYPAAAAVIALVNNKMVVVEQFRKTLGKVILEIPAGKLDPHENPELAAIRELKEETGYITEEVSLVEKFYTSPGFSNAQLYVYFTDNVTLGEMSPDDDEDIIVKLITLEEAEQLIQLGAICDVKTIFAVYAWKMKVNK